MAGGNRSSTHRSYLYFGILGLAMALAVASAAVFVAVKSEEEQRQRDTVANSEIVALHAERVILGGRSVLLAVRQHYEQLRDAGVPAVDAANAALEENPNLPVYVRGLLIADAEGRLLGDEAGSPPGLDLSDRHYFSRLRSASGWLREAFGSPVIGRVSRRPFMPLSQRLLATDGTFAGIAVAIIDPRSIESFYSRQLETTVDGILLANVSGDAIFSWPSVEGADLALDAQVPLPVHAAANRSINAGGTSIPLADGGLLSARPVADLGLIAIALRSPLPPWWSRPRYQLPFLAALLAGLAIWGFVAYVGRNERRLRAERETAEAATRAKSVFLAVVSHEVRTPMSAVLSAADLLAGTPLSEEQESLVEVQRGTARTLLVLLDDILDYSKIEAGRLTMRDEDFDLDRCLHDVVRLMRAKAREKGVEVVLDRDPELPRFLRGDPTRLRQILFNLLGNAVKFTERGRVTLSVCLVDDAAETWLLEVKDQGIGMTAEQIRALFTPFIQGDATIAARFGGSGLGLYIVKRLVNSMGGSVAVESEPERGTAVGIRLPLRRGEAAQVPDQENFFTPLPRSAAVLLAEDVPAIRGLLSTALARMGQQVTAAENGAVAVAAATRADFDLILLDLQMPVVDGIEALRRIREFQKGDRRSRIVALTADTSAETTRLCRDAGFDAVLPKPPDWAVLRRELLLAVPAVAGSPVEAAVAPPPAEQAQAASGLVFIDWASHQKLREEIGEESYGGLIAILQQSLEQAEAELDLLERSEEGDASELLHRLRGLGGDLGCVDLVHQARRLEVQGHGNQAGIRRGLAALRSSLAATRQELEAGPGDNGASAAPVAGPQAGA